ncbi:MAG: response regulator [Desulfoprunum sp.]|nr:response regulator [Desulfoprunum sp.]
MPTDTHLPRILIVDDEPAIQRFLKTALSNGEFSLSQAENGHAALATAVATKPDVILLDLGLPDMDGVEVIDRIRQWSQVPIIVLSVRDRETDKVRALDSGADDYLTKPFGVGELLARIRVMLRRSLQQTPEPVYRIDELEVDLARRLVLLRGEEISLTPTEYDVLRLFVINAGKVLTHRQILKQIWGSAYLEQPHILRVNVSNLRHKLETDASRPRYILTESGVGYRFKSES